MCNSCCCCYPQTPPLGYTPTQLSPNPYTQGINAPKSLPPPPVPDETFHYGYTFCNCQQCCNFTDCCNCSGLCYDCNVGNNSVSLFNSSVGPLYEYYDNACCRSCFAAQYSGAGCIGSLFPCWMNDLIVVNGSPNYLNVPPSLPTTGTISYGPPLTSTPFLQNQALTLASISSPSIPIISQTQMVQLPQVSPRPLIQPVIPTVHPRNIMIPKPPLIQRPAVFPPSLPIYTRTT